VDFFFCDSVVQERKWKVSCRK